MEAKKQLFLIPFAIFFHMLLYTGSVCGVDAGNGMGLKDQKRTWDVTADKVNIMGRDLQ
jgi:hypothetical protein